jgi:TPR repeat protein
VLFTLCINVLIYSSTFILSECWNGEPNKRPSIHEVVDRLGIFSNSNSTPFYQQDGIINQTNPVPNENLIPNSTGNSLHGELFQIFQNSNNANINTMSIIVNEIVDLIFREVTRKEIVKQSVLDYLNIRNINPKVIHDWLLNNQNNSNSVFLLGYFNYHGIGIAENDMRAFILFINATKQVHILAQYYVGIYYQYDFGIYIKNRKRAFNYFKKIANEGYAMGQFELGWFYENGVSVEKDFKIAAYWYERAANNEHLMAMHKLGNLYLDGIGVDKNHRKAFELFKKSAQGEYPNGIMMLGYCYSNGIGIDCDNNKAIELYQKAANLGNMEAQYNLALKYELGDGIERDIGKAIYWYEKAAKQGNQYAQNKLKILKKEQAQFT